MRRLLHTPKTIKVVDAIKTPFCSEIVGSESLDKSRVTANAATETSAPESLRNLFAPRTEFDMMEVATC